VSDQLNVAKRDVRGTTRLRRLRQQNKIPAILYGHGLDSVALTVQTREIEAAIRHGSQMVELKGDLDESALIKDVQWDQLGTRVLHVDLTRVSKGELVEVDVAIDLRGDAPGAKQGGIVKQMLHEVTIRCPADTIPEKLDLMINHLNLDESLTVSALHLPDKATFVTSPDEVIVQCVEPIAEEPEESAEPGAAEPEVIGRKDEDDEESED
jgi:large subunit ribosomal protein L25